MILTVLVIIIVLAKICACVKGGTKSERDAARYYRRHHMLDADRIDMGSFLVLVPYRRAGAERAE